MLEQEVEFDDELLLSGRPQVVGNHELVLYKPRWGAFYATPLQELLDGAGVDTIVFAGCNFPNCPRTSVYQASERDYTVIVASDAVSGLYERGEEELAGIGVVLAPAASIVSALTARSV